MKLFIIFFLCFSILTSMIFQSFKEYKTFYKAVGYLFDQPIFNFLLIICAGIIILKIIVKLKNFFIGEIKREEWESIENLIWPKAIAIFYFLIIFNEKRVYFLICFASLITWMIFHWVVYHRADNMISSGVTDWKATFKITMLFKILLIIDCYLCYQLNWDLFQWENLLLFCEIALLCCSAFFECIKYIIGYIYLRNEKEHSDYLLVCTYLNFINVICECIIEFYFNINVVFITLIIPFYLFYEIPRIYKKFQDSWSKIKKVNEYHSYYKNIPEIRLKGNEICIICFSEVILAKRLACGHYFHTRCLKSWLSSNNICPTCKTEIKFGTFVKEESFEKEITNIETKLKQKERGKSINFYEHFLSSINFTEISKPEEILKESYSELYNNDNIRNSVGSIEYGLPCIAIPYTSYENEYKRLKLEQNSKKFVDFYQNELKISSK